MIRPSSDAAAHLELAQRTVRDAIAVIDAALADRSNHVANLRDVLLDLRNTLKPIAAIEGVHRG